MDGEKAWRQLHENIAWYFEPGNIPQSSSCTTTYLQFRKLSNGQAKIGRPARIYMQQFCEDTGYSPEDLPEAMKDRDAWRERVSDIRAGGTTWYIYIYVCVNISINWYL